MSCIRLDGHVVIFVQVYQSFVADIVLQLEP